MREIDPIDRIALMEKLGIGKECTVCEQNSDPYCKWKPDVVDVCEAICTAPAIEPQRKKGKWIDRGWSGDGRGNSWHEWECSECKHITKGAKWDFCPNCGAEMTEKSEEPKKCDTCKHEKERWFSRCADCTDYELWEGNQCQR